MLAIPWYMVSELGKGEENAIMMATITLLTIFWGMYAGTLIDRFNRKRIFQGQQAVAGLILAACAAIGLLTGQLPVILIGTAAGATLFSWTLYYPNLYAFVQELFEPQYYKQINSGVELIGQTTNFIGMLVGSVLLAGTGAISWWPASMAMPAWELSEIFLLDGSTYLLSAVIVSFIRYSPGTYFKQSSGKLWSRFQQGYQFLRQRPQLLIFGVASYMVFACLLVFVQVGMAMYVHHHMAFSFAKGAVMTAEFEAVYSLGAISIGIFGLLSAKYMQRTNLIRQITFLLVLMGAGFLAMSLTHSELILAIVAFCTGIANSGTRILRITYLVRIIPNEVIGRANSFFQVINVLFRFFFMLLLASVLLGNENIIFGLMLLGAVCLVAALVMWRNFSKFDQEAAYG